MSELSQSFGERLVEAMCTKAPLCAGIDPHPELLEKWGVGAGIAGLEEFSRRCVEAFASTVALIKPQVAFYEAYGSAGLAVLENLIAAAHEGGALVLADAKRGDIGSTMAAYARAWLDPESPLCADAVTVSPYLGMGSLAPTYELASAHGRGVFVLANTSNPEATGVQSAAIADGTQVKQHIVDEVARLNASYAAHHRPGNIGVVVGATVADPPDLSALNGPVLLPGVGAQGGTMRDVESITQGIRHLAVPSVSRAILSVGPDVSDLRQRVHSFVADELSAPGRN